MNSARPVIVITFADGIEGAHLQLLKDEKSALENTLWDLHAKELIEIYKEESLSRQELIDLLPRFRKDRIILFHYAGHAEGDALHTEGGEARAQGVAALLGEEKALKVVVLNGCSTMAQVQGLKEKGVKAIVATSSKVGDEAAKTFSTTFYKHLVTGYNLKEAFSYAIAAVQTEKPLESNIIAMRSISLGDDDDEPDTVPWDLYYDESYPEILDWTLPSPADPKENIDPSIYKTPEELQALSYPEKKGHLLKVLDNDLNRIIPDLDALLSSESEHREPLRLLHHQLNDYFRNKYSDALSRDSLTKEKNRIKLNLNHMISMIESKDFDLKVPASPRTDSVQAPVENMKKGGIWRKIPPKMQVNTAVECKVKIAVDKDQLKQEKSASNIKIRIDTVRTTNEMSVDLFEPPLGDSLFDIKFMGTKAQLVDIEDPTEWTFYVTPNKLGKCKVLLHVSIIERVNNKELVKVIPFEEEIEVVDYKPEELGVFEKVGVLNYLPLGVILPIDLIKDQLEQEPEVEEIEIEETPEPEKEVDIQPEPKPKPKPKPKSKPATPAKASSGSKLIPVLVGMALAAAALWYFMGDTLLGDGVAGPDSQQEEPLTENPDGQGDTPAEDIAPEDTNTPVEADKLNPDLAVEDNVENPGTEVEDEAPANEPEPESKYGTVKGVSKTYPTVKIGDVWWMKENVNEPGGQCPEYSNYGDPIQKCNYGSLYLQGEARQICQSLSPGKWVLPSSADWNAIKASGENFTELALRPGGISNYGSGSKADTLGFYWTGSNSMFEFSPSSSGQVKSLPGEDFEMSCRCVKK